MSKGLEALKELKKRYGKNFSLNDDERCRVIEKELNCIDKLKQENEMLIGFGGHFFDESFKQNKVLKIIKDRFSIQFQKANCGEKECLDYYGIIQIGINPIYIKTKEEYDLLKEVLS